MEALDGVDTVVEVGAGGVLTGLVKRCRPDLRAVSVATPDDLEQLA
jgi:malonyl CoA-acyl carrier protein transacylase